MCCPHRIVVFMVEPEGFQLEVKFILLQPLHEVGLLSRLLCVS